MAEYYITYNEVATLLEQYISETKCNENLIKYKAEVLAALTGNFERNDLASVYEMVTLWKNQISRPSELLLGNRYIRVQSVMLGFLEVACTSGLIDAVICSVTQGNFSGFTISVGAGISIAIWQLLNTVKKLDNWDFCVYMQALTHFYTYKKFTKNELIGWLPSRDNNFCNMHNSEWLCDYLTSNDTCNMIYEDNVDNALESLYLKGILEKSIENREFVFKFKR